jgi:hypothetical protein
MHRISYEDLIESGFRVAVVKDATAAAILPGLNGYEAALVNFQMIASHVFYYRRNCN